MEEGFSINIQFDAKIGELKKRIVDSDMGRRHELDGRRVELYSFQLGSQDGNDVIDEVLSERGKGVPLPERQTTLEAFSDLIPAKFTYVLVEDMSSGSK